MRQLNKLICSQKLQQNSKHIGCKFQREAFYFLGHVNITVSETVCFVKTYEIKWNGIEQQ